jgi:hypothetical protein
MSNYQTIRKAHGLTIEQAEAIQQMDYRNAFMYGSIVSVDEEAELRRLGLITDTKAGRIECAKLSRVGKEIARKLNIAELDDLMAS